MNDNETKEFADEMFKDPERQRYMSSMLKSLAINFDKATDFDKEIIAKMPAYKSLINEKNLYNIATYSHMLAKQIKEKSGIRDVELEFTPGTNKDEGAVNYHFGNEEYLLTFPYNLRRHIAACEFKYARRLTPQEHKWYQSFMSDEYLGRYQYKSDESSSHAFIIEKQWDRVFKNIDSAFKIKYSSKWIDINTKEQCWTKQFKMMYDLNRESSLFSNAIDVRPPNYLYVKASHKSRKNKVDSDKASGEMLKNAMHPDRLLSLKLGHKNVYESLGLDALAKSSLELGYNQTDAAFLKFKTYLRNYYNILNKNWVIWHNSLSLSQMGTITSGDVRVNDTLLLSGIKGLYDFPGAKTYRDPLAVEAGKEHLGDRVGNNFLTQYETKFYFPMLAPFNSNKVEWLNLIPYIYGTVAYAMPTNRDLAARAARDNFRASTGIGITLSMSPISVEFYYSLGSIKPKCDLSREFGFYLGFD